jgi:hypothetical protein
MAVLVVVREMEALAHLQAAQVLRLKAMMAAVTAALAADHLVRMAQAVVVLAVLENHNLRHLRRQVTA